MRFDTGEVPAHVLKDNDHVSRHHEISVPSR